VQISNNREQGERSRRYAVLRYASVCHTDFLVGLWSYRPRATARLGRGSFVFIGY